MKIFKKISNILDWKYRDFAVFIFFSIFNLLLFYLIFVSGKPTHPYFTQMKGDALTYVEMSENLINSGIYGLTDPKTGIIEPTTVRMPGFCIIYAPISYLMGKDFAINFLLIFQVLLAALAKTLLLKLVLKNTNKKVYLIGFLLLLLGSPITQYNNSLYTESISSSLLMISLYLFLANSWKQRFWPKLLLSGIIFALCVFLRPYLLPFFLPLTILMYLYFKKENFKKFVFSFFIFVSPFVVIESIWIVRNFSQFNKFIPLETSFLSMSEMQLETRNFIRHYGGEPIEWNTNADGTWFESDLILNDMKIKRPNDAIFPSFIFENGMTMDSLKIVRAAWNCYGNDSISKDSLVKIEDNALRVVNKFDGILKENHTFRYYFLSRLISIGSTYYQPGSLYKSVRYPLNVVLVFLNAFVSFILLTIGGIFTLFYLIKSIFKRKVVNYTVLLFSSFILLFLMVLNMVFIDHEVRRSLVIYFPIAFMALYGYGDLLKGKIINLKFDKINLFVILFIGIFVSFYYTVSTMIW